MPLVVLTGSVAWRRVNPWLTTVLAVTAFTAFQLASGYTGGGAFEVAAIALNFYLLGRRARGRERTCSASAAVFAYWLVGVVVITYSQPGGSVGAVLGSWALVGGLPFALGRTLETRTGLTQELEASTARLADAQEARAGRAAAEERNRMARELHDVIAHDVSVMVLQSSGARSIAGDDIEGARGALRGCRERGPGRAGGAAADRRRAAPRQRRAGGARRAPGLSQLDALADRARAAGLPVELQRRGSAAGAIAGRGSGRLPRRAGGADERDQARRSRARTRERDRRRRLPRAGGLRRRARRDARRRQRPRTRARARRDERARQVVRRRAVRRAADRHARLRGSRAHSARRHRAVARPGHLAGRRRAACRSRRTRACAGAGSTRRAPACCWWRSSSACSPAATATVRSP